MRRLSGFTSLLVLVSAFAAVGCAGNVEDEGPAGRGAQALPAPVSGSDIVAVRGFVGDPLRGMGPGQPGSIYTLKADDAAPMASTTKSFALLLAVEAVQKGKVSLNDIVTISTKAADIDNNHQSPGHSEAGFPAGEQIQFQDLLYAMMLPSGGDATIAVAQHVAVKPARGSACAITSSSACARRRASASCAPTTCCTTPAR